MSKLTERLSAVLGVRSWAEYLRRAEAPAWVEYRTWHEHWISQTDRRAIAFYRRDGKVYKREFRERSGVSSAEDRRLSIEAARKYASERVGGVEWVRSPWPHVWVPKDAHKRVLDELKATEKAARAT